MPLPIRHPIMYIKYLMFKLRWILLDRDEQWEVYSQVHWETNVPYWDNYEQYEAAQTRGDDYLPDWQDLAAYIQYDITWLARNDTFNRGES